MLLLDHFDFMGSFQMIQHRNLQTNQVLLFNSGRLITVTGTPENIVGSYGFENSNAAKKRCHKKTLRVLFLLVPTALSLNIVKSVVQTLHGFRLRILK